MDLELRGRVALITGGSAGIGLAIATALAAEGVDLLLVARDEARLATQARNLADTHAVRVEIVAADVAIAADVERVVSAAKAAFGGVDILINNAGTGSNETVQDAEDAKWQFYWELHVMAAVRLARGLIPSMKARGGGVILHNASICAVQPLWYEPIYNVTKAALMMLSKTLSTEVIKDNIRVNCLNAGLVLTPDWVKTATELTATDGRQPEDYIRAVAEEHAPIRRFAQPAEVADFVAFLCSARASYAVGSTYFIDGGMLKTV